jgi:uncharacterized membrane protein
VTGDAVLTLLVTVLAAAFVLMTGLLAGLLSAVDLAVVPALAALPADRYLQLHRLLDPRFDPLLPRFSRLTLGTGVLLAFLAPGAPAKAGFAVAGLCVVGVALVSELRNVRLNRRIDTWDAGRLPGQWSQVRHQWGRWHRIRTLISIAGFVAAVAAALLTSED